MHCRLGNGVYTASDSAIDQLPQNLNAPKYTEGDSSETSNQNYFKKVHVYKMKILKVPYFTRVFNFLIPPFSFFALKLMHIRKRKICVLVFFV